MGQHMKTLFLDKDLPVAFLQATIGGLVVSIVVEGKFVVWCKMSSTARTQMAKTAASGNLTPIMAKGLHLAFTKTIAVSKALLQFAEHEHSQSHTNLVCSSVVGSRTNASWKELSPCSSACKLQLNIILLKGTFT